MIEQVSNTTRSLLLLIGIALLLLLDELEDLTTSYTEPYSASISGRLLGPIPDSAPSEGHMVNLVSGETVLPSYVRGRVRSRGLGYHTWGNREGVTGITSTASNGELYFANGYLKHFAPYRLPSPWLAQSFIAQHFRYNSDTSLFKQADIWMTGPELYSRREGDCEDHSILLADWLIAEGYDARVVLGRNRQGGHAWVVVFIEGVAYLLEAVDKAPLRTPPLASLAEGFFPDVMFNGTFVWQNTAGELNRDYSSWRRTAQFLPQLRVTPPVEAPTKAAEASPAVPTEPIESVRVRRPTPSRVPTLAPTPAPERTTPAVEPNKRVPITYRTITATAILAKADYQARRLAMLEVGSSVSVVAEKGHWLEIRSRLGVRGYILAQDAVPEKQLRPKYNLPPR